MEHSRAGAMPKASANKLSKKLIVLCDGTWQNSDIGWEKSNWYNVFDKGHPQVPTNVTRMARAILPEGIKDPRPQIVYYQAGVGSGWSFTDQAFGGVLAYGLSENVREAYGYLAHNFQVAEPETGRPLSDEIYLLGFSRGAFTARSIGGMISSVGLLTKDAMEYFYSIFEDYQGAGAKNYVPKLTSSYKPKDPRSTDSFKFDMPSKDPAPYLAAYKKELLRLGLVREVKIQAIAVWDTVGTLGLPVVPLLQRLNLPTTIHKYRFYDTGISNLVLNAFQALALNEQRSVFQAAVWEKQDDNTTTNLKQVWFPGVHSNVGGGYDDSTIADFTLAWMMDQLSPWLEFEEGYLKDQVDSNIAANYTPLSGINAKNASVAPWSYAQGQVYETLSFPTSLGGSTTRCPNAYHRLNYETGKPEKPLLRKTHEYIHASVRARMRYDGKDAKGNPYRPPALKDWKCLDGVGAPSAEDSNNDVEADPVKPGVVQWVYHGSEEGVQGRTMLEASLGANEQALLDRNQEFKEILFG